MITDVAERIDPLQKWKKLTSIGMVESVRIINGKTSVETRYFISSLENDAQKLAEGIRCNLLTLTNFNSTKELVKLYDALN